MAANLSSTFSLILSSDREIVITRMFDAPRDLVFEAHSSCEHLSRWLGPRYLTMVSCEMEFRPGGKYRFVHRASDGSEYAFRGEFREIVRPERLVRTFEFEGMAGHVSLETLILEEREGKTKLTITALYASKDDHDGIVQSGMEAGVRESWDRLEEYVASEMKGQDQ
jgi:uncharacterized protein YndB with AHSA1/START domain